MSNTTALRNEIGRHVEKNNLLERHLFDAEVGLRTATKRIDRLRAAYLSAEEDAVQYAGNEYAINHGKQEEVEAIYKNIRLGYRDGLLPGDLEVDTA